MRRGLRISSRCIHSPSLTITASTVESGLDLRICRICAYRHSTVLRNPSAAPHAAPLVHNYLFTTTRVPDSLPPLLICAFREVLVDTLQLRPLSRHTGTGRTDHLGETRPSSVRGGFRRHSRAASALKPRQVQVVRTIWEKLAPGPYSLPAAGSRRRWHPQACLLIK